MIKIIAASLVNASRLQSLQGFVKANQKKSSTKEYFPWNGLKLRYGATSWIYKQHLSSMNEQSCFKNTKLSFKAQNMNFLPFFMHPAVGPTENPSIHLIRANNVLLLSFVLQVEDPELSKLSWDNRKTIGLNFRETLKFLNIQPGSNKSEIISKQVKTQEFVQRKILQIEDISQNQKVQLRLKCLNPSKTSQQLMEKWQVTFNLAYDDYLTLLAHIKSNILYASGCAYQIQYSKARNMAIAQQKSQRFLESLPKNKQYPKKQFKHLTKATKQ